MTDPSALLLESQSLTTTPVAVFAGANLTLTTIYAANAHATDARFVHFLAQDGSTRRFAVMVPANFSGIVMTIEGGVKLIDGLKIAGSTAKGSVTGSLGTDLDVVLFGRNA